MRPLTRSSIHRAYYYEIQERCNLIKDYIKELCDLAGDSSVAYYLDIETSTIDQNFKLYRRMD